VEAGAGVTDIAVGAEVYALTAFDRDGAEAEYTIALPSELAPKPHSLDDVQAAAVPLSALTAWQAFFEYASLTAGQTVLIHGAAGGVGVFAVQLARWAGAQVIGTASARNRDFLRELGVNETIDYTTTRFEEVVHEVDLVLDTVGGETVERSWGVLKKGGVLISVASPPSPEQAHGVRSVWFIVKPNREQLSRIGTLIDAGRVRSVVETVLPLSQARQAYEQAAKRHTRGKIVLRVD
jgi:NADPH:quinone reductase-like Zn-dependent oxidoreductase